MLNFTKLLAKFKNRGWVLGSCSKDCAETKVVSRVASERCFGHGMSWNVMKCYKAWNAMNCRRERGGQIVLRVSELCFEGE